MSKISGRLVTQIFHWRNAVQVSIRKHGAGRLKVTGEKKRLRFRLAAGSIIALVLLVLFVYVARPLLAEDNYSKRGSIAYYLTIHSSIIKSVPLMKEVGTEDYYSSSGDGPKLPANGVIYLSKEDPKILMESLNSFLISRGFTKDLSQCSSMRCSYSSKDSSVELAIKPMSADTQQVNCTEYFLGRR